MNSQAQSLLLCIGLTTSKDVTSFTPPRPPAFRPQQQHATTITTPSKTSLKAYASSGTYLGNLAQMATSNFASSDYISTLTQIADYASTSTALDPNSGLSPQEFLTDLSTQLLEASSRVPTMEIPPAFDHGWFYIADANIADADIGLLDEAGNGVADLNIPSFVDATSAAAGGMMDATDGGMQSSSVDVHVDGIADSLTLSAQGADTVGADSAGDFSGSLSNQLYASADVSPSVDQEAFGNSIQESAGDVVDSVSSQLQAAAESAHDSVDHGAVSEFLHSASDVTNSLMNQFVASTQGIEEGASDVAENIGDAVHSMSSMLSQLYGVAQGSGSVDSEAIIDSFEKRASDIADSMPSVDSVSSQLQAAAESAHDSVDHNAVSEFLHSASDVTDSILNQLVASTQGVEEGASDVAENIGDAVHSMSSMLSQLYGLSQGSRSVDSEAIIDSFEKRASDIANSMSNQLYAATQLYESAQGTLESTGGGEIDGSQYGLVSNSIQDGAEDVSDIGSSQLFASAQDSPAAETVGGTIDETVGDIADSMSNQVYASTEGIEERANDAADSVSTQLYASAQSSPSVGEEAGSAALEESANNVASSASTDLYAATNSIEESASGVADSTPTDFYASTEGVEESANNVADSMQSQIYASTQDTPSVDQETFSSSVQQSAGDVIDSVSNQMYASTGGIEESASDVVDSVQKQLHASIQDVPSVDQETFGPFGNKLAASAQDLPSVDIGSVRDSVEGSSTIIADSVSNEMYAATQDSASVDFGTIGDSIKESADNVADSVSAQMYTSALDSSSEEAVRSSVQDSVNDAVSSLSNQLSDLSYGSYVDQVGTTKTPSNFAGFFSTKLSSMTDDPVVGFGTASKVDATNSLSDIAANSGVSFNEALSSVKDKASAASSSLAESFSAKFSGITNEALSSIKDKASATSSSFSESLSAKLSESGVSMNDGLASVSEMGKSKLGNLFGTVSSSFSSNLDTVPRKVVDMGAGSLNVINRAAVENKIAHSGANSIAAVHHSVEMGTSDLATQGSLQAEGFASMVAANSPLAYAGEKSIADVADGVVNGVKFIGGIIMQLLNVVLKVFAGTSVEQVLQSAHDSVYSVIDGATTSAMTTINNIGNMSVAEVLQNLVYLIISVANILLSVVDAVVKLLSGKEATEWALVATSSLHEQADNLAAQASVAANDLTHASFTELTASVVEFSQHVGHEVVGMAGTLNEAAISGHGVGDQLSGILTALQTGI